MNNKDAIIKLAVDMYQGNVNTEFASKNKSEQMEVLRSQLIETNGGSKKITYKTMRNNVQLFEIIETILELTDIQGLENNDFFERFVDYRNIALGDENNFYLGDNSLFTVSETAEGVGGTLRQRINKGTHKTLPTNLYTVDAYAELNRLLAGRIDIIEFVEKMRKSFANKKMTAIYTTFYAGISGLPAGFTRTGSYDEDNLLDIIAHVEASTGEEAMLVGTKKALSKVTTAIVSEKAKESYNNMGYYGSFNGTDMIMIKQSHKAGTHDFAISDNDLWIMTSDGKPVKFVTLGEAIFEQGNATANADRTVDMFAGENWGIGIILNQFYGQYRIS